MPTLTFTSSGPMSANIHLDGQVPSVKVEELEGGELVAVTIGTVDVSATFVGPLLDVHHVLILADNALTRIRGQR